MFFVVNISDDFSFDIVFPFLLGYPPSDSSSSQIKAVCKSVEVLDPTGCSKNKSYIPLGGRRYYSIGYGSAKALKGLLVDSTGLDSIKSRRKYVAENNFLFLLPRNRHISKSLRHFNGLIHPFGESTSLC